MLYKALRYAGGKSTALAQEGKVRQYNKNVCSGQMSMIDGGCKLWRL